MTIKLKMFVDFLYFEKNKAVRSFETSGISNPATQNKNTVQPKYSKLTLR